MLRGQAYYYVVTEDLKGISQEPGDRDNLLRGRRIWVGLRITKRRAAEQFPNGGYTIWVQRHYDYPWEIFKQIPQKSNFIKET